MRERAQWVRELGDDPGVAEEEDEVEEEVTRRRRSS